MLNCHNKCETQPICEKKKIRAYQPYCDIYVTKHILLHLWSLKKVFLLE
jgi:hypothetical protein